jgi:uncharacterized membrane-anchored protein
LSILIQPVAKIMALLAAVCSFAALAQAPAAAPDPTANSRDAAAKVFADATAAAKTGPQSIALSGQGSLKLPAGYHFIAQPHATRVLNAMGNPGEDPRLQGLIFPVDQASWFMTVRFESSGYIKDDDAKDWNADDLLKNIREGTEANNSERKKMGVPELEILGWAEKPAYESATHRLVWAMSSKERGAPATDNQGVNYNTYALGREGYFSLNLVTDLPDLPKHKVHAATMLTALEFDNGKRYADFNASTDRVAEYGIAALVAGVAAKKLGLLAIVFAFLAKFAKVIFVALAVFGGGIFKFFGRKKNDTPPADMRANEPSSEAQPAHTHLEASVSEPKPKADDANIDKK